MKRTILGSSIGLATASLLSASVHAQVLDLVGTFDSGAGEGTEVISVQNSTARMALTNSEAGTVSILDLSDPAAPALSSSFNLGLVSGEGINGVAFHPTEDYFAVAIQVTGADNGRVELRSATTGALLNTLTTGSEPDAVAIDKQGRRAVVSDEGETFKLVDGEFVSPPGSVTVIDLRDGAAAATATTIALPDATGTPGMVSGADKRFLERGVDLDGDGDITEDPVDLNGDGDTDDTVVVGFIDGVPVEADEGDGELVLIPLLDNSPRFLEPEIGAFARNGQIAYVAMQENNGVAVVNVSGGNFIGYIGLGITTHAADISDDDFVDLSFSETLVALREPDGIAVTPDGRYLVTADEGDTDPKASKTDPGFPTAGGRTVSVFDAATGAFLGDTGNQIDEGTAAEGLYPDGRSDSKGSEPENLVTFELSGVTYAAVGLERADAGALISLADPANPTVVDIAAVNPGTKLSSQAPEGVAVYKTPEGSHFVYMANEGSGIVSAFEVVD